MPLTSFQLANPWLLVLLVPVLAGHLYLRLKEKKIGTLDYPPLQYRPERSWPRILEAMALVMESLTLIAVILSLAGPHKSFELVAVEEEGIDVQLVVDISASMQAKDFPPTRLEATKQILAEFTRMSGGNRVGVTVFARRVYTLAPLTSDHTLLRALIEGLSLNTIDHENSGGTAIGDAMLYAVDALITERVQHRAQVMIVITDGESNEGADTELVARFVGDSGIKAHTIGIGRPEPVLVIPDPAQPDWSFTTMLVDEPLKKIAEFTGGLYRNAADKDALARIFADLARLERTPLKVDHFLQKKMLRAPFSMTAGVLFIGAFMLRVLYLRRPLK